MAASSTSLSVTRLLNDGKLEAVGGWLLRLEPQLRRVLQRKGCHDPSSFDDDVQDLMKSVCARAGKRPFPNRHAVFGYILKGLRNRRSECSHHLILQR